MPNRPVRYPGYDGLLKQALRMPTLGEALTGLGPYEAWRDYSRLAIALTAIPVGLAGVNVLRMYGSKDLFAGKDPNRSDPVVITLKDYYKVLELEKQKKRGLKKKSSISVVSRLANVAAHHPFLSVAALGAPGLAGSMALKYVFKPIQKKYIKSEMQQAKLEYLQQLRAATLLSKRVNSGKLEAEDIENIPEDIRMRAAEKLRARTGRDFTSELKLDNKGSMEKLSGHIKQGILGILTSAVSLPYSMLRVLYAAPLLSGSVGIAQGVQERPLNLSVPETERAIKEWKSRTLPYMDESGAALPPEEFFEEIEEPEYSPPVREEQKTSVKPDLGTEAEERRIVNKYVQQRLKQLEDDRIKETKVRGTKIISK